MGEGADGLHARLPHHPRAPRRVVGGDDPDRQPPWAQARRSRCPPAGPALVQVHGGDVRGGCGHRHRPQLRVRLALAEVHGSVGRGVRGALRLRGPLLLHRGHLRHHLHLRLASPEAVDPLLDRGPDRRRRRVRQHLGGRGQRLDELAVGLHDGLARQHHRRRPDRCHLQQGHAPGSGPHGGGGLSWSAGSSSPRCTPPACSAAEPTATTDSGSSSLSRWPPSPHRCRWAWATRWPAGCTTTSRPSSRRSSWFRRRVPTCRRRCSGT